MSLWLGGAHRAIGKSRVGAQAEARRLQKAAGAEAAKAVTAFWGGLFSFPSTGKRRKSWR